jgi:hypothetical protein
VASSLAAPGHPNHEHFVVLLQGRATTVTEFMITTLIVHSSPGLIQRYRSNDWTGPVTSFGFEQRHGSAIRVLHHADPVSASADDASAAAARVLGRDLGMERHSCLVASNARHASNSTQTTTLG